MSALYPRPCHCAILPAPQTTAYAKRREKEGTLLGPGWTLLGPDGPPTASRCSQQSSNRFVPADIASRTPSQRPVAFLVPPSPDSKPLLMYVPESLLDPCKMEGRTSSYRVPRVGPARGHETALEETQSRSTCPSGVPQGEMRGSDLISNTSKWTLLPVHSGLEYVRVMLFANGLFFHIIRFLCKY